MTHLLRELRNTEDLEDVKQIQFSLFSHQDIKRGSVADILTPDTYDGNIPKNNGLFDHNMGSIDAAIICPIDEKKEELCPGYFGKVDLALPVFNNHFIPYIEKVCKCVCFRCSNLLLDKTDPKVLRELEGKKGYSRFTAVLAIASKNKKCTFNNGCFVLQPTKYTRLNATNIKEKNNIVNIIAEFSQNAFKDKDNKALNQQTFTPLICYQIFKKIKDEDVDFMGFSSKYSRPEWMIITSLAVPPPSMRPSIRQPDNQRCEDDLTYALSSIVKTNKGLKQVLENNSTKKKIDEYQGWLQYLVSTYMDNEIPGVPPHALRSSFRPLKAITQRLKGKEGRIRGNIMGKRVDYSARTVISVDPNIDIDEFGVPMKIAMNLTIPEIVTKYNIGKLRKMIRNGPKVYPGAKTVTKAKDGDASQRNFSLKHVDVQQIADNLEVGDVVHRHLLDGDVCLFNRQPTLHRMSMMSHRIRILPFSTFRLNINATEPYNADFDGDEMNMHIPQSLQTHEELKQITSVPTQIISPGTSSPSMGIIQDTLIGGYLLTAQDQKIRRDQMNNFMMFMKDFNGNYPEPAGYENGQPYWNGKQLYSLILPDVTINQAKNIKIIRGEIVDGYLNSQMLGRDASGLIKQIYNTFGIEKCKNFFNDTENLITRWLMGNSFSIGFGDCIVSKEDSKMIKEIINKNIQEAYDLIIKAHHGLFMPDLDDKYKVDKMESDLNIVLSKVQDKTKDFIVEKVSKTNNIYIASDKQAGSVGKTINLQQIMACVGQQSIWGERVSNGFTDRTLPHFPRNDLGPDAKGFCRNSFIEGLNPSEMFFHAMGGRTGSISTAIKTAESGYTSRKFIKATEDLKVNYDFTVRNASNFIVQFCYGDDNFDPSKLEKINKIELIEYSDKKLEEIYKFDVLGGEEDNYFGGFMTPEALSEMKMDNGYKTLLEDEYQLIRGYRDILRNNYFKNTEAIGDISTFIPFNLYRTLPAIQIRFNIESFHLSDLTPQYVIDKFEKTINDMIVYLPEKNENWKLFRIIFKSFLSPKRVISEYRFNKLAYDYLMEIMREKMIGALINPGELVGIIASQTLGQSTTQLTLNSVTYETEILVRDSNKKIKKVQIGDFTVNGIEKSKKIDYMEDKDTTYAELTDFYEVPCATEDGRTVWRKIEAVTKHPVINLDGSNTMLKITTDGNREVIATKAKSFLQLIDGKIQSVDGINLKIGDYLPVSKKALEYLESFYFELNGENINLDYNFGKLIAERCFSENKGDNFELMIYHIEFSNYNCIRGFLGCVFEHSLVGLSYNLLLSIQIMLKNTGIVSKIMKEMKDDKYGYKLMIESGQSSKIMDVFDRELDIESYDSDENVPNIIDGNTRFEDRNGRYIDMEFDKIVKIEEVQNTTNYAYDLTVEDTRNFDCYNGLCIVDTFHLSGTAAGSAVITEGLPRLREVINVTKNLKSSNMTIYLKDEFSNSKDNAKKIQAKFTYTKLKDLLATSEILYDNKNGMTSNVEDVEFIKSYQEFTKLFDVDDIGEEGLSPWILRLTFDKESLMNRKITIQEVQETIKSNSYNDQDIECIFSDDSSSDIVMRIRLKYDGKGSFMEFMKDFEKKLIELTIRGVNSVERLILTEANIIKYNIDGSYYAAKDWILMTDGSNLLDILADDAVDVSRTLTNDILEFHEIFGIEATRNLIYKEVHKIFMESHPNPRHIQMLADTMTYRGKLMQIDRHGMNKNSEIGPIGKASFEEVMNIFTKAALFAEKDNMKGMSANIMTGQFCKAGTNTFDILVDEDKLMEAAGNEEEFISEFADEKVDVDEVFRRTYKDRGEDDKVGESDFEFGLGMELKGQHLLNENTGLHLEIKDAKGHVVENNLGEISIEEPVVANGNNEQINFGELAIEEPEVLNVPTNIGQIEIEEPVIKKTRKVRVVKNKK
jgi:DNA-directed RNA polymerase beta' subunit